MEDSFWSTWWCRGNDKSLRLDAEGLRLSWDHLRSFSYLVGSLSTPLCLEKIVSCVAGVVP